MRRSLLVLALVLAATVPLTLVPRTAAQTTADPCRAPVQCEVFDTFAQWESGLAEGLLVTNNAGGELRLAQGALKGTFTSGYIKSDTVLAAAGLVWTADAPRDTTLSLELRGGPTQEDARQAEWQPAAPSDARQRGDTSAQALAAPLALPADTQYVQLRVSFAATAANASPVLSKLTLALIRATTAPIAAGLTAVPQPFGPLTLTTAPPAVQRADWDPGRTPPISPRRTPTGVILHQIGGNAADPLAFLRAATTYDAQVLGGDDLPFHYLVAQDGTIYLGRAGGPTSQPERLSGGDDAVQIALVGSGPPPQVQLDAAATLIAWLGQAYGFTPTGRHSVAQSSGPAVDRPNIAAYSTVSAAAADTAKELSAAVPDLRSAADARTIRARWYFAEGNPQAFAERLALLNASGGPAQVLLSLPRPGSPATTRRTTVEPGARLDLLLSDVITDTTETPAIVEANAPLVAERFLDLGTDIAVGPGVSQLSRVWYFADGSTENGAKTYLLLFNPQPDDASATITYVRADGTTAELPNVPVPGLRRTVIVVDDAEKMRGVTFATRVIATRPIVAERTIIAGAATSLTTVPGVVELARRWYFAEGTTAPPFQMRLAVYNPNLQPAVTTVTFLTDSGTSLTRRYAIPGGSRLGINVNEVVPELGVATRVDADRPVAVERTMSWRGGAVAAATPGATAAAYTWRFADGRTSDGFLEYLLFNNPEKSYQARVTVEFTLADGSKASQNIVMPGGSRYTMAVHELYPGQRAIAATVRSTYPIVAERSLFSGVPGSDTNKGGATSLGVPERQQ